ncbi:methyltransferase domain-containing protein [Opitutaceae bacterium TAV4]|nr:methyltransferase domain-containing protein [Opitutaceae bacterium TAV4]RRJ99696.1 methyltransferase domain-containing protein [Opitutaceae bacterium TAV3]
MSARTKKLRPSASSATDSPAPGASAVGGALRVYLLATACISGAAVMIVEILGAKMLAPYIGTSHFVWTAQIGVTLVALAAGYALGGWLADRSPRPAVRMYGAILLASLLLVLTVLACEPVALASLRLNLAAGSLLASAFLFFPPLVLLGIVPPFLVRQLTASLDNVGGSVGRLSAISTLGSVAGTVAVGYLLVPFFANSTIMFGTAGVLALVALGYFAACRRKGGAVACILVLATAVGGMWLAARTAPHRLERFAFLHRGNSNFGMVEVVDDASTGIRYYLNDLLIQNSYLPATKQSESLFTYMLHGLARAYAPGEIRDVLCIGMGVGIVPMQFAREGASVDVVEINPAVLPLAERFFDFDPSLVRVHIGDGRQFTAAGSGTKFYDTIILDAFLGESPPSHLMTREALDAMRARLRPGGTLVINTFGSFQPGRDFFLRALDRTLADVFATVRIHAQPRATGTENVFFVATQRPDARPLRTSDFSSAPERVRERARMFFANASVLTDKQRGMLLTDDYNPVDFYDARNRAEFRRLLALSVVTR